jgi:hypothetical protein
VAGIGDEGVLTAIVNRVAGKDVEDMFLSVGGLISPAKEHVSWLRQKKLRVGDDIQVKIVEAALVDEPGNRHRADPARELQAKQDYVRNLAKELGWKIQMSPGATVSRSRRKR